MNEQDPEPDYVIMSDQGLKDFVPAPIRHVNNEKAQIPAVIPPPLPPRLHQKSPTLGKTSNQSPQLNASKSAKLPASHTGGVKENNQSWHLNSGEVPGADSDCLHGILPKVEEKCHQQFYLRLPLKAEINASWHEKSQRPETDKNKHRQTKEAEQKIIQNRLRQETEGREWAPMKRIGETGENEKIAEVENVKTGKPSRQILVLFTDQEEFTRNRETKGKGEVPGNIWSTIQTLASDSSKSSPVQGLNEASANRQCPSEPHPPPKPPRKKNPPNLQAVSPTQVFTAVMTGEEEVEERRKEEDGQPGHKVLEESDEKFDGNTDTQDRKETHILKSAVRLEGELQRGEQMFDLKPLNSSKETAAVTGESETVQDESQHQHGPDPPPQEALAWINTTSTDSSLEASNREKQKSEQSEPTHGDAFSKLPSGRQKETEATPTTSLLGLKGSKDTQEGAETLQDGPLKQTNHKANTKHKMKDFGKKMMCRLKKGKEEKKRVKVGELEHDETLEDDAELTLDDGDGGVKDGETDEGMRLLTLDVSGAQTYMMERSFKRRSPFGSFEVCSPVTLTDDLLSGDEWSRYLYQYQSTQHDPPPHQTLPEDTAQPSVAEQDREPDAPEADQVFPEESVYEDVDLSTFTTDERQQGTNTGASTAPMSPRTQDSYDELIQPVASVNTDMNFSHIKSEGVLDTTVQKYLVRLSKKRKHRAGQRRCRLRSQAKTLGQTPSPVCPQHVFAASVFYSLPIPGVEEVSAVKPGGSSPKCLTKIKMALKDKTMQRTAQTKEDREK
ncbi:uncharacterized protein V6R79_017167 [Siganus canaliculatus]